MLWQSINKKQMKINRSMPISKSMIIFFLIIGSLIGTLYLSSSANKDKDLNQTENITSSIETRGNDNFITDNKNGKVHILVNGNWKDLKLTEKKITVSNISNDGKIIAYIVNDLNSIFLRSFSEPQKEINIDLDNSIVDSRTGLVDPYKLCEKNMILFSPDNIKISLLICDNDKQIKRVQVIHLNMGQSIIWRSPEFSKDKDIIMRWSGNEHLIINPDISNKSKDLYKVEN
jgi:hypothetical protein